MHNCTIEINLMVKYLVPRVDIMKLNSITQKQLIDIKNQLNKKYDKISLNNKKELVNCYSDIITRSI